MAKKKNRPKAVYKRPKKIADFIVEARRIVKVMGDNTPSTFGPPTGKSLVDIGLDIGKLSTAEDTAGTHVAGSADARDIKYDIVDVDILGLLAFVQTLMDNAASESIAISICAASGFSLAKIGVKSSPDLKVVDGEGANTVKISTKSKGKGVIYEWQESLDGKTWVDLDPTKVRHTLATGTASGVEHFYRYRTIINGVKSKWSSPGSIFPR